VTLSFREYHSYFESCNLTSVAPDLNDRSFRYASGRKARGNDDGGHQRGRGRPSATVYRLFSSKLGILRALLDVSIAGDDEAASLQDRAGTRVLFADTDPVRQLSGFAGICRQINARSAPVYRILLSASGADPEAAALLAEYTRQRQEGQGQIASSLARPGALRQELTERDAADIIHALMSPEVYRLLVDERAWPPGRYERWLKDILIDQLLAPPATGGGRTDP
jgi:AcrR family transcriptional regulator